MEADMDSAMDMAILTDIFIKVMVIMMKMELLQSESYPSVDYSDLR
jgi:hypothetical protein